VTEQIERELAAAFHEQAARLEIRPPLPAGEIRRARLQSGLAAVVAVALIGGVAVVGERLANGRSSGTPIRVTEATGPVAALQRAIERSGIPCELTRFPDPVTAIKILTKVSQPDLEAPHLILTDLKMPGMSGLEFVQWLRASRFSCIPVIMFSGSSLPEDILAAYRHGTNSFSIKPVSVHDLDEIVNTVLKYWKETCQTPTSVLQHGAHLCGK